MEAGAGKDGQKLGKSQAQGEKVSAAALAKQEQIDDFFRSLGELQQQQQQLFPENGQFCSCEKVSVAEPIIEWGRLDDGRRRIVATVLR